MDMRQLGNRDKRTWEHGHKSRGHGDTRTWGHEDIGTYGHKDIWTWGNESTN